MFYCRFILFVLFSYKFQRLKQLNAPLEVVDPEIADIIELEKARQWKVKSVSVDIFIFSLKSNFELLWIKLLDRL